MDLVTAYSNRQDLANVLVKTLQRLRKAQERGDRQTASVRSVPRSRDFHWRVADRLSATDMRRMLAAFEHGTPKWKLAEQYGLSMTSVKRVLRQAREARQAVES